MYMLNSENDWGNQKKTAFKIDVILGVGLWKFLILVKPF